MSAATQLGQFEMAVKSTVNWATQINQIRDADHPDYGAFQTSVSQDGTSKIRRIWRNAQLIAALVEYWRRENDTTALDSALLCGEWFLRNQVSADDERIDGLFPEPGDKEILHIEEHTEILGGILDLYEATGDRRFLDSAKRAFQCIQTAQVGVRAREALAFYHDFSFKTGDYPPHWYGVAVYDSIFWRMGKALGDNQLIETFRKQCDENLLNQHADGGFYLGDYASQRAGSRITVYWSVMPNFVAYEEFGNAKYLQAAGRACQWLSRTMNADGSFFYAYNPNGAPMYRHVDGVSTFAAVVMWATYMRLSGEADFSDDCQKAIQWGLKHAFGEDAQPHLRGAFYYTQQCATTVIASAFAIRALFSCLDWCRSQETT